MDTTIQQAGTVQQVLKYTYGIVPIMAGLDKFTNLLTNWENYLSPSITNMLSFSVGTFMHIYSSKRSYYGYRCFLPGKTFRRLYFIKSCFVCQLNIFIPLLLNERVIFKIL